MSTTNAWKEAREQARLRKLIARQPVTRIETRYDGTIPVMVPLRAAEEVVWRDAQGRFKPIVQVNPAKVGVTDASA